MRPNGTWNFQFVEVVTYVSDYDDPSLPDLTGRLTEVGNYNLTPTENFVGDRDFP